MSSGCGGKGQAGFPGASRKETCGMWRPWEFDGNDWTRLIKQMGGVGLGCWGDSVGHASLRLLTTWFDLLICGKPRSVSDTEPTQRERGAYYTPKALAHSPSQVPLSCPVATPFQREAARRSIPFLPHERLRSPRPLRARPSLGLPQQQRASSAQKALGATMKKPLMKSSWGAWGWGQLGAGHGCEYLEKNFDFRRFSKVKVVVAAAVAVVVVRASAGGGTHVLVGEKWLWWWWWWRR